MNIQSNINNMMHTQAEIRSLQLEKPFLWLHKGWQYLVIHPSTSLAYGAMVSMMGVVILLFASNHIYLVAAAISGFLLVGPFLAIGLCELSRQQERGQSISFEKSLAVLTTNKIPLRDFSTTLLMISIIWFILSGVILFALFGDLAPSIKDTLWGDFLAMVSLQQILLYLFVGGILACVVFALSVVAVPAIIDSNISALDAMLLSTRVVMANLPVMIVWAGLIALLIAIGFLSLLLGMVIIYPLLGHATWHAYRDLVEIN